MDLSGSWDYIIEIARSRLAHNKTSHHVSDFGDGIELIGVAGEIVARRFLGMPETIHARFDGGVDLRYGGYKVDVKATVLTPNISHRFLQWPENKRIKSDVVLLTAIDPITKIGTVLGYASRSDILNSTINRERFQACYEIPVPELHPAWELEAEFVRSKAFTLGKTKL
jgi:hypothetical protein